MKKCNQCFQEKSDDGFKKNRITCKDCRNQKRKIMKPLEDDAKNFYETIVKQQCSFFFFFGFVFVFVFFFNQRPIWRICSTSKVWIYFIHLKDFPSPFREKVAQFHEHYLKYGNILDVMLLIIHEKNRLQEFHEIFTFRLAHKCLHLKDKPAPKSCKSG